MQVFEILNQAGIPKVFWYVLSFSIFILTLGMMYLIYNAQNFNIEIAKLKIQIVRKTDKVADAVQAMKNDGVSAQSDNPKLATLEKELAELKSLALDIEHSL